MILVFFTYLANLNTLTTAAGITYHKILMGFIYLLYGVEGGFPKEEKNLGLMPWKAP